MQPMMAAYASHGPVTTDVIQQYLDENKQLILAILDNQNSGKAEECAENQAKLQRNLMYLAAIADNQPQGPTIAQQYPPASMQSGPRYMPHQQAQQMTPQTLMAARSAMMYAQSPMSALQQQQAMFHSQLGMATGGNTGYNMIHGDSNAGGTSSSAMTAGVFPDYGRNKQDGSSGMHSEGRGGSSGGQSGDGTEEGN